MAVPNLKPLISEAEIQRRVDELADALAKAIPSEGLVVVGLLKGTFVFTADLARALSRRGVALAFDFMKLSSYGAGTISAGAVRIDLDVGADVKGRHVLLVDDIVDTGRTLAFAAEHLRKLGARQVTTVALLDKPDRREVDVKLDHVGFTVPNYFVVGYGIDHADRFRELPFIGYIKEDKDEETC